MNLHRAHNHEWSAINPATYNHWQHLASRTGGFVTPGNGISIIGLVVTATGLLLLTTTYQIVGAGLLVVGRLADLADGFVAEKTGTKSPVGEAIDALCDKLAAFLALIVLAFIGFLPLMAAAALLIHNVINVIIFGLARLRDGRVHPTAIGKVSTALEWAGIILSTTAYAIDQHHTHNYDNLKVFAWSLIGAGFMLGMISAVQYIRQYVRLKNPHEL